MRAVRITRACWLNDRVNGDPGSIRTLDDAEAYEAVEVHKVAVYAPEYDPVTFVGPEAAAARLDELKAAVSDEFRQQLAESMDQNAELLQRLADNPVEHEPAPTADGWLEPQPEMKRPYGNATKAAWIDWAVHNGADPDEAASMTKNDLMGRYGERL